MTITPGRGTSSLHLRQPSSSLVEMLGKPAKRRPASKLREYWLYPNRGLEVIVSRRTHHLLSIFIDMDSEFVDQELAGATAQSIRRKFGTPALEGGGITLGDGTYFNRYFSYDSGIGFHFDKAERLKTVAIFAPRRKAAAKAAASAQKVESRSIAALRRA